MLKICTECSQELAVPDKWAMEDHGTDEEDLPTPVEHYKNAGHLPLQKPVATGCHRCGNIWFYTGDKRKATCPNCKSTTGVGTAGASQSGDQIGCGAD